MLKKGHMSLRAMHPKACTVAESETFHCIKISPSPTTKKNKTKTTESCDNCWGRRSASPPAIPRRGSVRRQVEGWEKIKIKKGFLMEMYKRE